MQHIKDYISTNAVIVLLVAAPTLIGVAFWSIVNPLLTLVFLVTAAGFFRPIQRYLISAGDSSGN